MVLVAHATHVIVTSDLNAIISSAECETGGFLEFYPKVAASVEMQVALEVVLKPDAGGKVYVREVAGNGGSGEKSRVGADGDDPKPEN